LVGILFYYNMKKSIKDEDKNCSFVSNIYTDIIAFIVGALLIHLGYNKYKDDLLIILGIALITEHILQFSYKV